MPAFPALTESLCPHCLRRIPAYKTVHEGSVYLEKSCPEHGMLDRILLWNNDLWSYEQWDRIHGPFLSSERNLEESGNGCPFDCGICGRHRQATCTAIIEVTHRCNIACPVCFASAPAIQDSNPDLAQIEEMLQAVKGAGICPIQISGGEPTLRNDLPEIVALARAIGFDHIQINTNGIRIAQDAEYGRSLMNAGVSDFFLQFDGLTDSVYKRIRGASLLQLKLRAVERCAELKTGVILVPTLVRNVNEAQIGPIIRFAKRWIPTVKGVHFQPMTYLGRYPASPRNEDRILIPEILKAIEAQTGGELRAQNMVPSG